MIAWKIQNKSTNDWVCSFSNTFDEWLRKKFETNPQMIECAVFQDKSHFPLQISINSQNDCVYFKDQKEDVLDKNLSHQINRQSVKVMVLAALTWFRNNKTTIRL